VVRMFGPTSFYSGQEPLFVIDGVPASNVIQGRLSWLDPHDVESITALRDPASTAQYGVRGANGVIVIKTKGSHSLPQIHLGGIDYAILIIYFVFVLGIGWALRRVIRSSEDFFLSGRSIPAWIAGLAFISANLGAQEVIGMAASGAKYGIMTSHFYWVGAMPAMVFVGLFMMPFYYGSRARSV